MRNLKISVKLLGSFLLVIVLAIIVGVIGIVGMIQITEADTLLYVDQTKPLPDIAKILEYSQRLRIQLRNAVLYTGNLEELRTVEADVNDRMSQFDNYVKAYEATIVNAEASKAFGEAKNLYETVYKPGMMDILARAKAGESSETLIVTMESIGPATTEMVDKFTTCMNIKVDAASDASDANDTLAASMLTIIIVVLVIAVVLAVALAVYIARLISTPVSFMQDVLLRIGTKGDMAFTEDEYRQMEAHASAKDEVGASVRMLLTTVRRLVNIGASLERVAHGDLTADITLLSDKDTMGSSLEKMVDNLNNMFSEINSSTAQVATGSKQIADGAQALAQGSTEQAAAVEQLSSSISEIALKTKTNADMASRAANLAGTIRQSAEKGSNQMDEMMGAVKEINQASQNISKVIKAIDDIAFQTNILALNAAVEAARAGQHGKGFAVVAEEVRNLAAKSAAAAKDTGGLIANSIEKAELGARIADETAASLAEIVAGIGESNQLIGDIAHASEEQSQGIAEINKGIDQVAQVIQQNSATAEQSAAASEEMSGQSNMLEELIAQFKLKNGNTRRSLPASQPAAIPAGKIAMPERTAYQPTGENVDFGKY